MTDMKNHKPTAVSGTAQSNAPELETLDALFAEAAADGPDMPADLAARMLDAAHAEQDRLGPARDTVDRVPVRGGILRQFFDGIGGWSALAGMVTATVAGVWIGVSPPDIVAQRTAWMGDASATGEDLYLVDVASAFDALSDEE
ncbi:MAG: hypothetical protein ACRBBU_12680 [Pseudooceanicola sp.]